jgi:hypothetical protein
VKQYVETSIADIDLTTFDAAKLGQHCVAGLIAYFTVHPERSPRANGDRFESTIVLASYDPVTANAFLRTISVAVTDDGISLKAVDGLNIRFGLEDVAEPAAVGEQPYLIQQVLPRIKDEPISDSTRRQIGDFPKVDFLKVKDASLQNAVDMATDLIAAASRMTETIPATSGIGGPIDVRVLGTDPRPVRWTPK